MVKPGTEQVTEGWQADARGAFSDQSPVHPHDVLLNLDLNPALLFVANPGLGQLLQEPFVVLRPPLDQNLLVGLVSGASSKIDGVNLNGV